MLKRFRAVARDGLAAASAAAIVVTAIIGRIMALARAGYLVRPYPAEKMTAYEIGQQINRRGYDEPDIIDPMPLRNEGQGAPELPL